MKKFLFILVFLIPFLQISSFSKLSNAEQVYYAKVDYEEIFLYSSPSDLDTNKLFILPKSYFVKLLNEANDDFYYCNYKDVKGYVKKSEVLPMAGTPAQPFVEGRFRTFSLTGLGIYSSPVLNSADCITTIPYLTDDLVYYGTITGQELVPDKSDQWIYCKYNEGNGVCGYVYSVFCDKTPIIVENTERFEIVENPFLKTILPKELSPVSMTFIILGVALPCLIVLFLLIKPTLLKDKLNTSKPKMRAKRRHGDYFEFDDSDLT